MNNQILTQAPRIVAQRSPAPPLTEQVPACLKQPRRQLERHPSILRFAPLAWLKLRVFLHAGETEVGFFGISGEEDLLYIQDLAVPRQITTAVCVDFDDVSVADHFESSAEQGIMPVRCGRIWIHTHPGDSPSPSRTDEETFARAFGGCDWAVMAIVARGGATYARMNFSAGPGGSALIPIEVDWENLPEDLLAREGSLDELFSGWLDEYGKNIFPEDHWSPTIPPATASASSRPAYLDRPDVLDELYDRQFLDERMEELYFSSMHEEALR